MRKILWICVLAAGATLVQAPAASAQTSVICAPRSRGARKHQPRAEPGPSRTAEVALDPISREIAVSMRVFNLPNGATASHIHVGPKGVTGPVVIDFPIAPASTGDFS